MTRTLNKQTGYYEADKPIRSHSKPTAIQLLSQKVLALESDVRALSACISIQLNNPLLKR